MTKFIEKLIKLLAKMKGYEFIRKFMDFIFDVFGKNGDALDQISGVVNNAVKTLELFEDCYKDKLKEEGIGYVINVLDILTEVAEINPSSPLTVEELPKLTELGKEIEQLEALKTEISTGFGLAVDEASIKLEKAESKFAIVSKVVRRDLEKNGIDYALNILYLSIELAATRYQKSK